MAYCCRCHRTLIERQLLRRTTGNFGSLHLAVELDIFAAAVAAFVADKLSDLETVVAVEIACIVRAAVPEIEALADIAMQIVDCIVQEWADIELVAAASYIEIESCSALEEEFEFAYQGYCYLVHIVALYMAC